jgi:phospholipid/cholesterol/gamma-HCH transport system permease protein
VANQAELETISGVTYFRGAWTVENLAPLEASLRASRSTSGARFDASGVTELDTSGGWLLLRFVRASRADSAAPIEGLSDTHAALLELIRGEGELSVPDPERRESFLERTGRATVTGLAAWGDYLEFVGRLSVSALRTLRHPRRLRWRPWVGEFDSAGVDALPIVGLLMFLLGVVIAYQAAIQLQKYGADLFIVDLVSLSVLRELAPLITAIIVAGRTGASYTAQIGTMKVTEEVDALRTFGIDPLEILVLPKVAGLVLVLPLLTVFAGFVGIVGGIVMTQATTTIGVSAFLERFPEAVTIESYLIGVGKAPLFAMIIASVGCHRGFQVKGSAESVGRETTACVVQSIFLIIVADAVLSIIFSWLGI